MRPPRSWAAVARILSLLVAFPFHLAIFVGRVVMPDDVARWGHLALALTLDLRLRLRLHTCFILSLLLGEFLEVRCVRCDLGGGVVATAPAGIEAHLRDG